MVTTNSPNDVDFDRHSPHHTLGTGIFQAAPGSHDHSDTKVVLVSPNGTKYRLTVTDAGVLGTVAV